MENSPVLVTQCHPLYNYMHRCSLQLPGFYVHVNGLENLFLCLKFTINVFNTSTCLLLKLKKITVLAFFFFFDLFMYTEWCFSCMPEGVGFPGTGVTSCNVGAGNCTWALWKNSQCS